MFIGGVPSPVLQQFHALMDEVDCSLAYVCCSGSYRSERTIHLKNRAALIHSNDVSFYSCVLGGWLAGAPVPDRFIGDLAFLEELIAEDDNADRRAAGAALALDFSEWGGGSRNAYKDGHFRHLRLNARELLVKTQAKLAGAFGDLRLASFQARDWVVHMRDGISQGAAIVGFPPTYKMGYERLYKWLDQQVEWTRPTYDLFDPATLPALVQSVHDSGAPYVFFADQLIEGLTPRAVHQAQGKRDCILYASAGEARLSREHHRPRPFSYTPLDLAKIHAKSVCRVEVSDGAKVGYIRSLHLKREIAAQFVGSSGDGHFLVYIDDMLAGCLIYRRDTLPERSGRSDLLFLLGDISVTREGRVSKLITRLALNRAVTRVVGAKLCDPVGYITTTAYSEHPASMKYRGLFELQARKPALPPMTGFQLQYGAEVIDETPQQAFDWWWTTHGDPSATTKRANGGRRGGRR